MKIQWEGLKGNEEKPFINALEALKDIYGEGPFELIDVFLDRAELGGEKVKFVKINTLVTIVTKRSGKVVLPIEPTILAEFFKNIPSPEEFQDQFLTEAEEEENKAHF